MIRRPSRRARQAQWVVLAAVLVVGALMKQASDRLAERGMYFSYNYLAAPANFDIPSG